MDKSYQNKLLIINYFIINFFLTFLHGDTHFIWDKIWYNS
jgi:hypothetical protein